VGEPPSAVPEGVHVVSYRDVQSTPVPLRQSSGIPDTGTAALRGRCALVTGAASGIGRAIAHRAATDGATVLAVDRDDIGLKTLVEAHPRGAVIPLVCDLSDLDAVGALASVYCPSVDVLANVAGYLRFGAIAETSVDELLEAHAVMVAAPWVLAQAVLLHMRRRGWGRFVNVTSIHGRLAAPEKGAYVACKHAMEGLSRTLALEGADHGITSNCIAPTHTETELLTRQLVDEGALHGMTGEDYERVLRAQIPGGRFVLPTEVANLAAVMWGSGSESINGASWTLDGGHTVRGNLGCP
jgi:3-hydroxybutyrate dehydrogenase